jgi:hypothetical protein
VTQFNNRYIVKRPVTKPCMHSELPYSDPATDCGIPSKIATHGFLCAGHYTAQQGTIPPAPRKPLIFRKRETDADIMRDILQTEERELRRAAQENRIETKRFGKYEPLFLHYVN